MSNRIRVVGLIVVAALVAAADAPANEWRGSVGLTYVSGFSKVTSWYEDEMDAELSWSVPVGVSFAASYEFDHGSRLGADLGPLAMILSSSGSDARYFDCPVGLTYGFNFIPHGKTSPYARVGVRYHMISSDEVDESSPGLFGAVGVEFFRKSSVGLGLEFGYDGSTVKMAGGWLGEGKEIKPDEFMASIRATF